MRVTGSVHDDAADFAVAIHEVAHLVAGAQETPPFLFKVANLRPAPPNVAYLVPEKGRLKGDRAAAEADLLLTLAGPAASHRHDPQRAPEADISDYDQARRVAETLAEGGDRSAAEIMQTFERRAQEFVTENWDKILAIACAFLDLRTESKWLVDATRLNEALRS
jgi:hypothetical protein